MTAIFDDSNVISLWYRGYTREQIHKATRISTGKISNIISQERERLGKGEVESIRRAGEALRESGKTWVDLADGVALQNYCTKHKLDMEELKIIIPNVQEKCKERGFTLADLPLDTDMKVKELTEIEATRKNASKEVEDLNAAKERTLADTDETDESLAKCKEMREFLASYHLSPDEPDKLKNAISNAKAAGYDEKVLVDMIARFNSVNDETKRKQETNVQQEKRIKDLDETLEEQRVQILANAVERAAGDRLKWA